MKIQYDKRGKGYEESKLYEFSHNGEDWDPRIFDSIDEDGLYIASYNYACRFIRECQAGLGKVHKKPLELKKGDCCQWTAYEDQVFLGWYQGLDEDGLRIAETPNGGTHNLDHESVRDIKRMIEAPNTNKQEWPTL